MMPDPFSVPPSGPPQIQDLQIQINFLKEEVKSLKPQPSPTVFPTQEAGGTSYNVIPGAAQNSNRQVWL